MSFMHVSLHVLKAATAEPVAVAQQIASAKANALRMKKEGKTEEALMWLRTAKMLEANGVVAATTPAPVIGSVGTAILVPATTTTTPPKAQKQLQSQPASAKAPIVRPAVASSSTPMSPTGTRDGFAILEDALRSAIDFALKVCLLCCCCCCCC